MAKFAVLFLAALAFQAAFAGVRRHHGHHRYQDEQTGEYHLDEYVGQIQSVTSDLSGYLHSVLPSNRLVSKTLVWQSHEFAQLVEDLINRLQTETNNYGGDVSKVFKPVLSELREIQASLQQIVGYTDISNVSQLKSQLNTNVQGVAEQIEKLVHKVQTDLPETQGDLYSVIRGVLADYLATAQNIQNQVQYVYEGVQGQQSPRQLGIQIQELTGGLTTSLQGTYLNSKQVKLALREYIQNIEAIVSRLQGEVTVGNQEIDTYIQQLSNKLRQLLLPLAQVTGSETIVNVNEVGAQLTGYLQNVAAVIEQLVQAIQTGSQQPHADSLVQEVLYDYLSALQQARFEVQGGYQRGIYGQSGYQGGLYGQGYEGGVYKQGGYKGLYGAYKKSGYKGGKYGYEGLYEKGIYKNSLYGQGLHGEAGVYGKNIYKQLYGKSGYKGDKSVEVGLYGQSGYKYGKTGKDFAIQIQSIAGDVSSALETVYIDNELVRQTLINLIREYVRNLEVIVERLEKVGYTSGVGTITSHQVAQNLKQIVLSLEQIVNSGISIDASELRNKLNLYIQNIATELEKLTSGVKYDSKKTKGISYTAVNEVLAQYLTATRNLQIQVQNVAQVAQRGQTGTGYGIQIQTLANGLTAALESVSVDNEQVRQVLVEQSRELAQYLQSIIGRLQTVSYNSVYGANIPQEVVSNLREIVVALQQVGDLEDVTSAQHLKLRLVAYIQDAATEIQKLLWVESNYPQQGQGQYVNAPLYGIFGDFVAALQNQQIQLQNIYQSTRYGQSTQQLAVQIQAITNNLAVYLQNGPSNGEQLKQHIEIQARRLAHNVEYIIERLEVEVTYTKENVVLQQVVSRLRQIIASLEQVAGYQTSTSVYELSSHLNVVLQNVASELRKLAYVAQYDLQETQGNLNYVVRSVLVQYLVVLQHVQIELQGINQTVQIGQTPRELALQIQVVAQRLYGLLRVVPDNRQTQNALIYQARRLSQIIEIIVNKLQAEVTSGTGDIYYVLQQVAANLYEIQASLQQAIYGVEVVGPYQLRIQLVARIQDAAVEIQKLVYATQSDIQQGQGSVTTLVRSVLIDYLAGLQNLQLQIQDNLQIVLNGQHPRDLAIQIQSIASRLSTYLQYVQPNNQQIRQTLIIQIGELAQTIENVVQLLHTEIKDNKENSAILKQVSVELSKISLTLQQLGGAESQIPVNELSVQLNLYVQNVVAEIQKLAYVAQYELQETQVGTYNNGVLNGVFNNVLATLRNILIQLQNTRLVGQYGQTSQELGNQIQTVTNHLVQSLQLVGASTKQVKQALVIQAFRYAYRIQYIVERLETEVSYNSKINIDTVQQVVTNLRQVVVVLQQIGASVTTSTTVDIRTQLIAQIQNVAAQIQKLLVAQSSLQQYQGYSDVLVKSVLIEYLAAVQNLQIRIQNIAQVSQKGQNLYQLAIQLETAVVELSSSWERVLPYNQLVEQVVIVEARQFAQVLANIVNKLQSVSGIETNGLVQEVAKELKQIQLYLQQVVGVEIVSDVYQQRIQLEVYLQRAAAAIEQLVWAVQPEIQQVQVDTGIVTVVREIVYELLATIQNVHIQIQNVIQNGQIRQYGLGYGLQGENEYQGQYHGLGLYRPSVREGLQGQYYGGLGVLRGQIVSPRQYLALIQKVVYDLSATLQSSALNGQQAKQTLILQARQLTQIIESVIEQLQQEISTGSDNVYTEFEQVIYRLREIQQSLKQVVGYNVFSNVYQLRSELDNYLQIFVAQLEKLLYVVQQVPQGNLNVVIRTIFSDVFNGLQHVQGQIQTVYQYGPGYGYGKGYGYTGQYGKGYGYGGQYGKDYGYTGQYGKGYGYAGLYGKDYGYTGQYGKGYGYAGQYGKDYGYTGQYGKGYTGQYGKDYGYTGLYGKGYTGQYGKGYGYTGQYGKDYGYTGQYGKGYTGQYGKGYAGLYDKDYGYTGQYGKDYGYTGQYGKGYTDQYGKDYGYTGQYGKGYTGQYGKDYGYTGQYGKGYGYTGQYGKDYGYTGQYGKGYGYTGQYGKGYGYGYAGQYDNGYKYNGQYGKGYEYPGQYGKGYEYPGQYGKGYGYADQYNNEYGYNGQYSKAYDYADLLRQYGKGYGYAGQYNKGLGYGSYKGLGYAGQYNKGLGYSGYTGQYNKGLGYTGQYNKGLEYAGQYGKGYGYAGQYGGLYGKGLEYADRFPQYDALYGYPGHQLGQYGNKYGYAGQYGKGYGLQNGIYGYQTLSVKQLAIQLQSIANRVSEELQTVGVDNKQYRQIVISQARQLVQVIDNIIDRLQSQVNYSDVIEQVIRNLRQIQVQLQQIASSGVLSTVYQIRAQYANYIQNVADVLNKLVLVAQPDVQVQGEVIRNVLGQYFVYLRGVQYQLQSIALGYQNPRELASQFQTTAYDLSDYLRTAPYKKGSIQAREYAQNVGNIVDRLQSQVYNKEDNYIPPQQLLYKLNQIRNYGQQDSEYDIPQTYGRLGHYVRDAADEVQNWVNIDQPQYGGPHEYSYVLPVGVLGDLVDATKNYHNSIRGY